MATEALIKTVKTASVVPDPDQPRKTFDEGKLAELADSILSRGLLQPITVRPIAGRPVQYQIVTGERRWRAHQLAGLKTIKVQFAVLRRDQFLDQIIENDARDAMTPMDRARAYQRCLAEGLAASPADLAAKLGLRQTFRVQESLSLLRLCDQAQALLDTERLTRTAAWQLTALSHEQQVEVLALHQAGKLTTDGLFAAACAQARQPRQAVDRPALLDVESRAKAVSQALATIQGCGAQLSVLFDQDGLQGLTASDAELLGQHLKMLGKSTAQLARQIETGAVVGIEN